MAVLRTRSHEQARTDAISTIDLAAEQRAATELLIRSLPSADRGGHGEWVPCSKLKNVMLQADGTFSEKRLGFKTFAAFVESRSAQVEYSPKANGRARIRGGALA